MGLKWGSNGVQTGFKRGSNGVQMGFKRGSNGTWGELPVAFKVKRDAGDEHEEARHGASYNRDALGEAIVKQTCHW